MKEIELKILEINPLDEIKKLKKLGFKKTWSGIVLEKIFDTKTGTLKRKKQTLRLRTAYGKTFLTLKQRREKHPFLKIKEEKEIIVEDLEKTEEILNLLGYQCMAEREKKRTSFKMQNINVEIDEYPGAKPYMEIEGTEKQVIHMLKKLNHPLEKTSKSSSSKILKMYGLNTEKLVFGKKRKIFSKNSA